MPSKLRPGLIDPHNIPEQDIAAYLAITYGGYLSEVQNRLWETDQFLEDPRGSTVDFCRELLSVQLRICIELLCFAVIDFDQITSGLIGKSKRARIDLNPILKKRKDTKVWPSAIDPNWNGQVADQGQVEVPTVSIPGFAYPKEIAALKGRLDDIVHGQRRPRQTNDGRLSFDEILQIRNRLKHFADRQVIVDQEGQGWFIDSRQEYGKPTGMQGQVRVIGVTSFNKS